MRISLIAAASENNVIGKGNVIPWKLPDDLQHFREVTKGHPVVMGRKTYESIGRPLPDRRNIVITRKDMTIEGCDVVHSFEEALELAAEDHSDEVFVIGGGEIYKEALPHADRIYFTHVHGTFEGDATFPEFHPEKWAEIEREEHPADEKHTHAFTFVTYERRI